MNAPTIIIALIILVIFLAIVGRGIYSKKYRKDGCGRGCSGCPSRDLCHPK